MALLVLLAVGLSLIGQVDSAAASAQSRQAIARNYALAALREAMGELQRHAGPDTRLTATAEFAGSIADPFWTGVWRSDDPAGPAQWLVSGRPVAPGSEPSNRRLLAGAGTLAPGLQITAPAVPISVSNFRNLPGDTTIGHYAWWVSDEGTKASLGAGDALLLAELPQNLDQSRRQQVKPTADPRTFFPELPSGIAGESLRTQSLDPAAPLDWPGTADRTARTASLRASFPHLTLLSRSVLADTEAGGLRQNLTGATASHPLLTPQVFEFLRPKATDPAHWRLEGNQPVLLQFPAPGGPGLADLPEGSLYTSTHPFISEFRLAIGFFHTSEAGGGQPAGLMRLRYHVDIEWVNPYPFPLSMKSGANNSARGYYLVFDGLPKLRVSNPHGGSIVFDMNDFDPTLPWNNESRRKLQTWAEFKDGQLLPGEVYWMLEPGGQAEGLARTLSSQYWNLGSPKSGKDSWFTLDDAITFEVEEDSDTGFNITVYPYIGELQDDEHPDAYSSPERAGPPVLRLLNIPIKAERTEIDGRSFTRESSTTYTQDNYNFAWYFRIFEDEAAWRLLLETIDPRDPVIDFQRLQQMGRLHDICKIFEDPRQAVQLMDGFSGLGEILSDDTNNAHNPEAASLVLADKVREEPLGVGVFRHLQSIGPREPFAQPPRTPAAPGNPWNTALDAFFFTGVPSNPPPTDFPAEAPPAALPNPTLEALPDASGLYPAASDYRRADAAARLLVRGAFNLHSTSVEAWEAVLRSTMDTWRFNLGAAPRTLTEHALDRSGTPPAAAFFRLPFSAAFAQDVFLDPTAQNLDNAATRAILGRQGARFLTDDQTRRLAERIVANLRDRAAPFPSLRAFAESGLLNQAIAEAGLNPDGQDFANGLGIQYPVHLDGADILSALHPTLSPRSDTFLIRAYGEVLNPFTNRLEGRAWCEATVQRFPAYLEPGSDPDPAAAPTAGSPNESFGRRFRILSLRWLAPDEI